VDTDFEVVIAGAGIAGLTAALSFSQMGLSVAIASPLPPPKQIDFRTSALLPTSVRFLQTLGLWENVDKAVQPFWTMRLIDDAAKTRGNGAITDFTSQDTGSEPLAYNVPNDVLRTALLESLSSNAVSIFDAKISAIETDQGQAITLSNGALLSAKLLVAADGRNSFCRSHAKIICHQMPSKQFAITCLLEHSEPHHAISTEFQRRGGPFTVVPMPGNHSSLVWIEPESKGAELLNLTSSELEVQVRRRAAGCLGKIKLLSKPQGFPIRPQIAQKFYAPYLALVAEAAHSLPPTGAQGLNLSLTDIATLSDVIAEALASSKDFNTQKALSLYERRRLPDALARFAFSNGLNLATAAQTPFGQGARRAGLSLLRSLPPIKRQLTKLGLQPIGYTPTTMQ